jgi:hypothetical protein
MTNVLPEFELGLELDSAEVRGILLYNNQEWGRFVMVPLPSSESPLICGRRVTFDFIG